MPTLSQRLLRSHGVPRSLEWNICKTEHELAASLDRELRRVFAPALGLAILVSNEGVLEALALATPRRVFVFYPRGDAVKRSSREMAERVGTDAFAALLGGQKRPVVGFGMARMAMHVRNGVRAHVRGVDLSCMSSRSSPGEFVKSLLDQDSDTFAVDTLWDAVPPELYNDPRRLENLCLRAWISARVAEHPKVVETTKHSLTLDTSRLSSKYFKPMYQMLIEVELLETATPRVLRTDFESIMRDQHGNMIIDNERFQNRIRPSNRTRIALVDENDKVHLGVATVAEGRHTTISLEASGASPRIVKQVYVLGKDGFSHYERAREELLLSLLQGKCSLDDPEFALIRILYFSGKDYEPRKKVKRSMIRSLSVGKGKKRKMNDAQADAVEAMVKSDMEFVVVHGPPGTGKTATISFATQEWVKQKSTVWIVTQSNVGVKNVAERLCKDGVNFRLLVAKEFYVEWHEHIYEPKVEELLIRTDQLPADVKDVAYKLLGVKVMLCTLSTLNNPSLVTKRIFDFVPLTNLVVDEASQIGILNYMHVLANFPCLNKVCFFGDPRQLPPFGQEEAPTLKIVFDVEHLKAQTYFLDTQYRMPVPLGSFISTEIYDAKLQSSHAIKSYSCVSFIDVTSGQEIQQGTSWVNHREIQTIVDLARHYYDKKNYCILTPYDAQRNELQKKLKSEGLRWDNVYNVDSYQGEEADFIIVSVVRTSGPGFLVSRNRVNVMLTRCKAGLIIVTSRAFMKLRSVEDTLLGRLCTHWERMCGRDGTWTDWRDVADVVADLPGVTGGARSNPNSAVTYHQPVQKAIAVAREASSHRRNASILNTPTVAKPLPQRPRRQSVGITRKVAEKTRSGLYTQTRTSVKHTDEMRETLLPHQSNPSYSSNAAKALLHPRKDYYY